MPSLIEIRDLTSMWTSRQSAVPRVNWLKFEIMARAIGCAAAAGIALAVYLAAPVELRDVIVAAFLRLDQPFVSP
jgi:hypothetical protein